MLFYFAVVLFGYVVFFVVTVFHRSFVVNFRLGNDKEVAW